MDQPARKRRKTSHQAQASYVVDQGDGSESENEVVDDEDSASSGLRRSLHGVAYQLKLLMLFLYRALGKGYSFRLATEWDKAEKLDDLVFAKGNSYRFLQAKHKFDDDRAITLSDLLTETDSEFSLQKYFISQRKIKSNLKGITFEDFVICTNIGIEDSLLVNFDDCTNTNDLLHVHDKGVQLKFKKGNFPIKEALRAVLKDTAEHVKLPRLLYRYVIEEKKLTNREPLLKKYKSALESNVIDFETCRFRTDFIYSTSPEIVAFKDEFFKKSKRAKSGENVFWQEMEEKHIDMSQGFKSIFKLNDNPVITDVKKFVKTLVDKIKHCQNNTVSLERRANIIKDNLDKLAGHILVQPENGDADYVISSSYVNGNQLDGNLNELRLQLLNENINLENYKFRINNFNTCKESDFNSAAESLPEDVITNEDIDDFLDSLIFAVNQPNEVLLSDIICRELSQFSDISLIESDLMADSIQRSVFDWMKERTGRFLTKEDGNEIFGIIKNKLSALVLTGPTLLYRNHIENLNISFEDCLDLSGPARVLHVINRFSTVLSALKIYKSLKNVPSYIFVTLKTMISIQDRARKAFKADNCNLLIIDCNTQENGHLVRSLCQKLLKTITEFQKKCIVLISTGDSDVAIFFKAEFKSGFKEIEDDKSGFSDLQEASKHTFLQSCSVSVQNFRTTLSELLSDDEHSFLVTPRILAQSLAGDTVTIGNSLPISRADFDCFIKIGLKRHSNLIAKITNENNEFSIVTSDCEHAAIDASKDILLVSDDKESYESLCAKYPHTTIHWATKVLNHLAWKMSSGSLHNLQEYLSTNYVNISDILDVEDRLVILSSEAGTGKSTMFKHVAFTLKQRFPYLFVVWVNLVDHSKHFYALKGERMGVEKVIAFLYKVIDGKFYEYINSQRCKPQAAAMLSTALDEAISIGDDGKIQLADCSVDEDLLTDIRYFNYLYNTNRVVVFLDGFDEISPNYADVVAAILKILNSSRVKQTFVSTRPHGIQQQLETLLSTFAYILKPFTEDDQKQYLYKYFRHHLEYVAFDEKAFQNFAEMLFAQIAISIGHGNTEKLVVVPLHLKLIAEDFLRIFQRYVSEGPQSVSIDEFRKSLRLTSLYERFMRKKYYDIRFQEKKPNLNVHDPDLEDAVNEKYRRFLDDHKIMALYELFGMQLVETLLTSRQIAEAERMMEKIRTGKEKGGVVDRIVGDKSPRFIHRNFTEYFAALWLVDNFDDEKVRCLIREKLFTTDFAGVRKFFDYLLVNGDDEVMNICLDNDSEKFKELCNIDVLDKAGRNIFHILGCYGHNDILNYAIKSFPNSAALVSSKDKLLNWDPCMYAYSLKHYDTLEIFLTLVDSFDIPDPNEVDEYSRPILSLAITKGLVRLARLLLTKGANVAESDDIKRHLSAMYTAVYEKSLPMVRLLVEFGAKVEKWHLKTAILFNATDIVEYLIRRGYETEDLDDDGSNALDIAYKKGSEEMVKIIRECTGDQEVTMAQAIITGDLNLLTKKDAVDHSSLFTAVTNGNADIVRSLLETGYNPNVTDASSNTPLHIASKIRNSLQIVELLVKFGADVNAVNKSGDTPLFTVHPEIIDYLLEHGARLEHANIKLRTPFLDAARDNEGNEEILKHFVKAGADFRKKDENGVAALHWVAFGCNVELFTYLVDLGADPHETDFSGRTPLHYAADVGSKEVIDWYVARGNMDILNKADVNGLTPLHLAVESLSLRSVESLVDAGVELNTPDNEGKTPLHWAANNPTMEMEYLVDKGVNVNAKDSQGRTPIMHAAEAGETDNVTNLIDNGAFLDVVDAEEKSVLQYAVLSHDIDVIREIMEKRKEDINKPDKNGIAPIHLAARLCDIDIFKYLLEHGASIDAVDSLQRNVLHWSCLNSEIEIVKLILSKGFDWKLRCQLNLSVMHLTAMSDFLEAFKYFESLGASATDTDDEGKTPLHWAVSKTSYDVMEYLLEERKDLISKPDKFGALPIHIAAIADWKDAMELLGGNYDAKDDQGLTALHLAIHGKSLECVKFLLEKEVDVNAQNHAGASVVHWAARYGDINILEQLLNRKPKLNVKDDNGDTALHWAIEYNHPNIIRRLLLHGSPTDIPNNKGLTAADVALKNSNERIRELFI